MQIHLLDPYRPRVSPVHELDGRVKFLLTLAFILTISLTPISAWPIYILLFAILLSIEILSGLGTGYVIKRSILALPFVLAAFPVIFTNGEITLFSISIGPWTLIAHTEGFIRFFSVALKSWLSVQAAIIMASSTPFQELLHAMRAVGVPRLLVSIYGLMWRYLFVLVDEALRLIRARSARSGQSSESGYTAGGGVVWRARVTGGMAGNLLLRAIERSDRIYYAMLSRGYDGDVRLLPFPPMTGISWSVLSTGLTLLSLMLSFGFLFWGR
jgi:cobalt/nickel transport system permease protein